MAHRFVSLRYLATGLSVPALAASLLTSPSLASSLASLQEDLTAATEVDDLIASEDGSQIQLLRAVVMDAKGRAQWRPDPDAEWSDASIDDILEPGAMIRTGRNSSLSLRVGQNATILVDRNTRLVLPEIIQDGQTLRTAVQLTRGRADFKVDRVGLTNDFSVVTPSTTLAVRGTDYGVQYGGLKGTELFSARTNEMNAIEVRYVLSRHSYYMSGGATCNDSRMNPVVAGLFQSLGPPRAPDSATEGEASPQLMDGTFARNPVNDMRRVDISRSGTRNLSSNAIFIPPPAVNPPKDVPDVPKVLNQHLQEP